MAGSRVVLVADDQDLARSVQAHLDKQPNQPACVCSFAQVHDFLDHRADGVLLLAAATAEEAAAAIRLVQDVYLQKLPPMVVLLDTNALAAAALDCLVPYVSRRLRWPDEALLLTQVVR